LVTLIILGTADNCQGPLRGAVLDLTQDPHLRHTQASRLGA